MTYRETVADRQQREHHAYRDGLRFGFVMGMAVMGTVILALIGFAVVVGWV